MNHQHVEEFLGAMSLRYQVEPDADLAIARRAEISTGVCPASVD